MDLDYDKIAGEILALKRAGDKAFWITLSRRYDKSGDAIRSWFEREKRKRLAMETLLEDDTADTQNTESEDDLHGEPEDENNIPKNRASLEMKTDKDGLRYFSSDRLIRMHEEELKDESFVLKAHGFDPDKWIVVSAINNYWQGMRTKDLGGATLYQSKVTVKPKEQKNQITFHDIEEFFESFDGRNILPIKNNIVYRYVDEGQTLVVNLADLHFGNEEPGYPTSDKVLGLLSRIQAKSKNRLIKKIIVANLGDSVHVDTEGGTTTAGTQVGERGTIYYHWENALVSLINFVSELSNIAPVEYLSISGNHDRVNGYTLSKALEYAFLKSSDNVTFDVSFSHRKYKTIGNSLFGFAHGDIPNKNQGHVLQAEERKRFGESKHAYLLMGHLHHISIKDEHNVIIATLPSVTSVDYWHEQNAYLGSWRGTFCYLVDDEDGISETWHVPA